MPVDPITGMGQHELEAEVRRLREQLADAIAAETRAQDERADMEAERDRLRRIEAAAQELVTLSAAAIERLRAALDGGERG